MVHVREGRAGLLTYFYQYLFYCSGGRCRKCAFIFLNVQVLLQLLYYFNFQRKVF